MSISRMTRWLLAGGALLVSSTVATPSFASPSYPTEVFDSLEMDCPPPCAVCHQDQSGGAGTATKVFAEALINEGLEGEDDGTVKPALLALEALGTDSDGDGVDDITELRQGRNPNLSGAEPICGPQYGCGARVANSDADVDPDAALLALFVASLLVFRRRRGRLSPSKRR